MRSVSEIEIADFERDGFLIVDALLSQDQIERVRTSSGRVHAGQYSNDRRPPALRKRLDHLGNDSSIRWYLNARLLDDDLWDVATDPGLASIAASLLRSRSVSLVEDQLLDKPSGASPCNFHQDYGYWLFTQSTQMVTCWIALVDMSIEMGPLQLIPGSHTWGHAAIPRELIAGSEESLLEAVEAAQPSSGRAASIMACLPSGSGVFFHSLTFHGSDRNRSSEMRRAFSLHWAGDTCTVDRSKLSRYTYPFLFSGIGDGDRVVNRYMPIVFDGTTRRP